jgi:adenylate cyclase
VPEEIERKFLVGDDGWRRAVVAESRIRQGYLARSAAVSVRIRLIDEDRAVVTIKSRQAGLSRAEYEYAIPYAEGSELLALCAEGRVEKTRFTVAVDAVTWVVDVFSGGLQGLVLAEVELSRRGQAVALPPWLGREVTDDARYRNESLARAQAVPA